MNRVILFFFVCTFSIDVFGQFTEFHPELDWFTIKEEKYQVHYHTEAKRTAEVVAKIAGEIWEPITSLYQYEPGTVHYVIKDIDDYSNGATYFFDNKIEIWTSALDFDLRGTHNWLRNVISHEFTHLVQIQASMKASRTVPAAFFQWLNYQDERRPDILYGYPNVVVSYPLATINVPAWFAEGTAQYMRTEFDYDDWDSHRDMILRSYALDGNMLTWNQMGVFGKTSLGNESVYNSGFALTRYISQKYGEDKLREISYALSNFGNFTIDAAFEDVLGKDGNAIYDEWREYLVEDYKKRTEDIRANLVVGDTIANVGFGNFYPSFSPDGKKILYISNKSVDYFGLSSIYEYDIETKKSKSLIPTVRSTYDWIPGENVLVYSRLTEDNPYWYNVHDIFVYDLDEKKEQRLTYDMRANQPSVSHDGRKIVFLFQKDGTTNLGTIDVDGKNFKELTSYENGEQVYNPKFSNDDSFIVFDYSYANNRGIAKISADGGTPEFIIDTEHDERNPVFDKEGNLIISCDETGIFNLYKINLETGNKVRLTNTTGGAFMADVNDKGDIVYAGYTSTGYKIFNVPADAQKNVNEKKKYDFRINPPLSKSKPNGDIDNFDLAALRNFNDKNVNDYTNTKYSGAFSSLTVFPYIRVDNYTLSSDFLQRIKPGLYVTSTDMLNRFSFFAGADINARLERDLFFIFEYKNKLPLLHSIGINPELAVELYSVSRVADVDVVIDSIGGIIIPTDVTYNLFEFDFVARHQIINRFQNLELRFIFSRYTATLGSFVIQVPGTDPILYPTTDDTYFIGRNLRFRYNWTSITPTRDRDINPVGFSLDVMYDFEWNDFNESGDYIIEDGLIKPDFSTFNFNRLEVNSRLYFPLWSDHTLTARVRAASILGAEVPPFFNYFLGGLVGIKGYPFYAVEGNEIAWLHLEYRFPLFRDIDSKFGHMYLDKIFLSLYFDIGDAWTGDSWKFESTKRGAGVQLRLHMNSYYLFPTAIFFDAAYGFDQFKRIVNNEIITYGKEWQFYGGILFGFDIVNFDNNLRF
ncbi:MAG: PD40 domain-containing protein [Ignavibacterium sp.]|nr:MAG: PD40 domain-containing protein [Ignavibacterium sp.]